MTSLLQVENVHKYFPTSFSIFRKAKHFVRAVDGVTFEVKRGERFCIVGETGSGKTTLARIIAGLIKPDSGEIYIEGTAYSYLYKTRPKEIHRRVQIIFQDPYSALNPKKNIRYILERPLKIHKIPYNDDDLKHLLELVGLSPAKAFLEKLPSQLSGGQRQRILIARALALRPEIIVADEPVSMLDASAKVHVLELLNDLRKKFNITYVMITHEMGVAYYFCDRIAVMYLGKLMELGSSKDIFSNPTHPYTQLLLTSTLPSDPSAPNILSSLEDLREPPSFASPSRGCRFSSRCKWAVDKCFQLEPRLVEVNPGHYVACPVRTKGEWD
jgi:oligopeptide/dipeptide ABC transporter ATP-binding protein